MAHLVLDCDGVDVIAYELIGDIITIGRSLSNDVVIDNPTVSAQPASLAKLPSGYHLKDLGSTNGTQVNGISISDAELMDGAEIRFAYVTGVFQNAIASIAHATELQLPGEHDCQRRFGFRKRRQFLVSAHKQEMTIHTTRVSNKDFWTQILHDRFPEYMDTVVTTPEE
jgi:hypothetical protein